MDMDGDQTIKGKLQVTDKVGIGTGTGAERPQVELHISQSDKDSKIYVASGGNLLQMAAEDSRAFIGTIGTRPLDIQTNESSRIYISENGNVGIGGITNPIFNLDVKGSINTQQYYKNGQLWKITGNDIAENTITSTNIKDGTITQAKLAFSIGGSQWQNDNSNGNNIYYSRGNVGIATSSPNFSLDINGTINATQFFKNGQPWQVTREEIRDNAINAAKIEDGSVGVAELGNGSVTDAKIANGNVTTPKIADANVTDVKLAKNAVITEKIADGNVTDKKLAANAVTTEKIKNGAITKDKLDPSIVIGGGGSSQWSNVSNGNGIYYNGGNVGIGTTTPQSLLVIRKDASGALGPILTLHNTLGAAGAGAAIDFNGYEVGQNSPTARIQSIDDGNFSSHLAFYTKKPGANTNQIEERLRIQSSGNVGIGTKEPQATLHIYEPTDTNGQGGNIKFFDKAGQWKYEFSYDGGSDGTFGFVNTGVRSGETRFQSSATGLILLTIKNTGEVRGNIANTSSRELKENITDFSTTEAIEVLASLNPVKFNYREDDQKQLKPGFIAEDVPELVATADRKGICALDIVAVLTKVIQQQQQELSSLKERLNALEASV